MTPHRVQLSRRKGWRMPPNTVKVSRPSRWGNPWSCVSSTRETAVALFRQWMTPEYIAEARRELRGKNLACWCPLSAACHADVLLEIANREETP